MVSPPPGTRQWTASLAPPVGPPTPGGRRKVATPAPTVSGMSPSAQSTLPVLSRPPPVRSPPRSTSVLIQHRLSPSPPARTSLSPHLKEDIPSSLSLLPLTALSTSRMLSQTAFWKRSLLMRLQMLNQMVKTRTTVTSSTSAPCRALSA